MTDLVLEEARATRRALDVPVGRGLLGRVVNPLGEPLDGKGPIAAEARYPIETQHAGIVKRTPIAEPVETGIMAIDALVPIGRGQRVLIIGDRSTGKTTIALDTIVNQVRLNRAAEASRAEHHRPLYCIYVAIGQTASAVAPVISALRQAGALPCTIVLASPSSDSAPTQYLAPFAGAAMAQWFIDNGMDALIVYDDLSKHALACAASPAGQDPASRRAYPDHVFYAHRRLLERAGGATCLAIIETHAADASAYVPAGLISIADGRIFLETRLFSQGVRPAISVGLSASRASSAAQMRAMTQVAGHLKRDLGQVRELAAFARCGSALDPATETRIHRSQRIAELFKQRQHEPLPLEEQVAAIWAVQNGYLDDVPVERVKAFQAAWTGHLAAGRTEVLQQIVIQKAIDSDLAADLRLSADRFKSTIWRS